MPNRILKESICSSENIDELSAFQEIFFYRLIVNCDDFGRMDARPRILASRLFPLKTVRDQDVTAALHALASAELITLYEVDGRSLLQIDTWDRHQNVRAKKSKYPAPCKHLHTSACKCNQLQADVPVIQSNPNPYPYPNAEAETRAREESAAAADDGELPFGLTAGNVENYQRAEQLMRRYRLNESDDTREALLEDAEREGWDKVETALKDAAQSDSRGGISVKFYRAILSGAGKKLSAGRQGSGDQMMRYSAEERRATYSAAQLDLDAEV